MATQVTWARVETCCARIPRVVASAIVSSEVENEPNARTSCSSTAAMRLRTAAARYAALFV